MVSFKYFMPLWPVSSRFWKGFGADRTVFHKDCESMFYNCVPNGFDYSGRTAQPYGECLNLSIFSRWGSFIEVSG